MRIPIESSTSYRGRNSRPNWLVLLAFVATALGVGFLGALFAPGMSASATPWYAALAKPAWVPPQNWFAPIWTTLYVMMALAAWLVSRERYHRNRTTAMAAYIIQLLINACWSPCFFGLKNIGAGLFAIVALGLAVAWTVREFARVKTAAALLLLPYLIWVSVAAALNLKIWQLNP